MIWLYILILIAAIWLGALAFLRKVWFYRDPARTPERDGDFIIAPADGRVVYIKRVDEDSLYSEKLGEKIPLTEITGCESAEKQGWAIGIYMSPLDVHFNYCPYPGKVTDIYRKEAKVNFPMLDVWEYIRVVWLRKMVDMFARKYHLENERNTIFLACDRAKMAVVLIADKFVAKIKCFVSEGDDLRYSQKLGFIERGSQVDLIVFSENVAFLVGINEQVYGGKTAIARFIEPATVTVSKPAAGAEEDQSR